MHRPLDPVEWAWKTHRLVYLKQLHLTRHRHWEDWNALQNPWRLPELDVRCPIVIALESLERLKHRLEGETNVEANWSSTHKWQRFDALLKRQRNDAGDGDEDDEVSTNWVVTVALNVEDLWDNERTKIANNHVECNTSSHEESDDWNLDHCLASDTKHVKAKLLHVPPTTNDAGFNEIVTTWACDDCADGQQ